MRQALLLLTLLACCALPGCKHHEEAAHDQGADMAKALTAPIDRTRQTAAGVEDNAPAILDTTANLYHTTTCRNADTTMETTTVAAAKAKGAQPDPACHPGAAR